MLSYYNSLQTGFTCMQKQKWKKFNSTERLQNKPFQRDVKYTWQWGRFSVPPPCPLPACSTGKWFSFHDPFEKTDQLMTILTVICGKACQLHHEHHMNQSYINHRAQLSLIRNRSALATCSWNELCWHPCSKPANLLGKQYSRHRFIIHCFYSAPLSLFHSSQAMTFLCVTTQQRRSNQWLPVSKVSFEEILPGSPGAFCLQFNIYSQQLFPLAKINAKIKACL